MRKFLNQEERISFVFIDRGAIFYDKAVNIHES